jgi:hypothetical protein
MRKRALVVLFGLVLIFVLGGIFILTTIPDNIDTDSRRQATIKAIYLTNTAVAVEFQACAVLRFTLRLHNVCGDEYRFWTWTPSTANPLISPIQVSATAIQETQRALGTVLAACATLKNAQQDNIYPCPYFWITATAIARQITTPANTSMPPVR